MLWWIGHWYFLSNYSDLKRLFYKYVLIVFADGIIRMTMKCMYFVSSTFDLNAFNESNSHWFNPQSIVIEASSNKVTCLLQSKSIVSETSPPSSLIQPPNCMLPIIRSAHHQQTARFCTSFYFVAPFTFYPIQWRMHYMAAGAYRIAVPQRCITRPRRKKLNAEAKRARAQRNPFYKLCIESLCIQSKSLIVVGFGEATR